MGSGPAVAQAVMPPSAGRYTAVFTEVDGRYEVVDVVSGPIHFATARLMTRDYYATDELDAYSQAMKDLPFFDFVKKDETNA